MHLQQKQLAMERRNFIKNSALATGAIWLNAACGDAMKNSNKPGIGLQLYTLRDEIKNGLPQLIEKIAQMGYTQLETFGYEANGSFFGQTVKAFGKLLKSNDLATPSGHVYLPDYLETNNADIWKKACDNAAELGQEYIVLPWLDEKYRPNSAEGYAKVAAMLNEMGKISKAAGLKFAYHNHEFEFKYNEAAKTSLYQVMLEQTNPELVLFEMDIFWVVAAGADPVTMFLQHPGRYTLWHVKDMNPTTRQNADVGTGSIDFKNVFAHKKDSGMQYFFIEQENYDVSPLESTRKSIEYVKKELVKV
jgi:sugar phosphate isomerase/epimerase